MFEGETPQSTPNRLRVKVDEEPGPKDAAR